MGVARSARQSATQADPGTHAVRWTARETNVVADCGKADGDGGTEAALTCRFRFRSYRPDGPDQRRPGGRSLFWPGGALPDEVVVVWDAPCCWPPGFSLVNFPPQTCSSSFSVSSLIAVFSVFRGL